MPGASREGALRRLEVLRSRVTAASATLAGREIVRVSLSGGLAMYPDHALDASGLLCGADGALYGPRMQQTRVPEPRATPPALQAGEPVRNLIACRAAGLAAALLLACGPLGAQGLVICGSSTMTPLVTEMARRFEELHPGARIEVRSGGSGKGIADLRARSADIAMISRALLDSERDLHAFALARDAVAVVVRSSSRCRPTPMQ